MKLITHNLLSSRFMKNVNIGYPLKLAVIKAEEMKSDYNHEFLQRMIPRIDYSVLRDAAAQCGQDLPETIEDPTEDQMKQVYRALFEIDVISGTLTCPETGKKFPISDGIPNMLCNEDE